MDNAKFEDNKELSRYQFTIGELHPHIEYKISRDGVIYLTHTRMPEQLRGQGIGTELVRQTLEDIDRRGLKLVPLCGFVASYIKKNPQWKHLLMEGVYV